ncbi:hypothetical protein Syun_023945 [Stephania yunnanensis]|uniref:Formin-like protein n=1 Tax=Stephania yunnanensis TaxID=152371 RepID=A0AAP0FQR4_9MAGN
MAAALSQPWPPPPPLFLLFCFFFCSLFPLFSSQPSPQNIETFFPFNSNPSLVPPKPNFAPPPTLVTTSTSSSSSSNHRRRSSSGVVGKAVAATAASTIVIAALLFFFFRRYAISRRNKTDQEPTISTTTTAAAAAHSEETKRFDGALKGLIVDENGLDVIYWRKLESGRLKASFKREVFSRSNGDGDGGIQRGGSRRERRERSGPIQELPLLQIKDPNRISGSSRPIFDTEFNSAAAVAVAARPSNPPPIPPPPPPMPAVKKAPAPPPPPPPMPGKKIAVPPPPRRREPKLKPLHWDKVTAKADHSMVWDKISDGSFRFDDDLMEALFGYVATNKKSPERNNTNVSNVGNSNCGSPAQVFILDPRKSQNIAIVVRSLNVSRQEILDGLLEGHGLSVDSLEKLMRIAPTKEEENQILEFDGNLTKLADAESFLYHILNDVPSTFARVDAMLFRSNYDSEILHLKESLQTLELGCKELRTRGLFLKLLEAVLKAGNRMNAGTARGNAQAFNLTALQKLSDVKSTDGKTTLLHFVVEEVVRSEGKRCVINRNFTLSRSNSRSSSSSMSSDNGKSKEEREKEYMMLGLPVVGGLSIEFSNVKKAATVDYDVLNNTSTALTGRVEELRRLITLIGANTGGGFVREMKGFLESAKEELNVVKDEHIRVMELVKRTTEYYQAGASKDKNAHPLQLFIIVRDFLNMVDQVCIDIARNSQKKKTAPARAGSSSPPLPETKAPAVRFPNLPVHFKPTSSSSDSDDF